MISRFRWLCFVGLAVSLGAQNPPPAPPRVMGPDLWIPSQQTVPVYTLDQPPSTPRLEELPLKESVSQYGITWTFDRPARVGQFVNGDWYVVGAVTIQTITPQPLYGDAWTGSKVVFTGHRGIDQATGVARARTGPYEHTPPSTWREGREKLSESYRRCCTSAAWVAEALALRLMKAESAWNHDAFFDYCDRWMFEDETDALKRLKEDAHMDQPDWAREGKTWETFVNDMWAAHRTAPGMPPTDGWKMPHDDSYLRAAMEKARGSAR